MKRKGLLIGFGLACALVASVTWSKWIFLWDGFGHRGIFLCSRGPIGGLDTIQCSGDVDELVYERVLLSEGQWKESWFSGGALEFRRVLHGPGGPEIDIRREFTNRWSGQTESEPPFGRTTCTCEPR